MIKRLGEGGMGCVYLAEDKKLHMKWAIKELGDSNGFLSYAKKSEISVLRKVSHPNLPRVTDIFDENKKTYMVMDYIEGKTLEEILSSAKTVPQKQFYQWSLEITSALSYLHSMSPPVIYRDLKPSNIIVRPSGSIVLIDFGTAKSFDRGTDKYAFGTKSYAAPEQFEGISDERSDIYALGRVMEKMAGNKASSSVKHICRKCLANDPEKRYTSALAVKRALTFSRDTYKYAAVVLIIAVLTGIGLYHAKEVARSSEMHIAELNENGRMENLYDNALMCFYELKDYDAAYGYFEQIDPQVFPEVAYYADMCRSLLSPDIERGAFLDALESFKDYNESGLGASDIKRKLKNDLDIAELLFIYSENEKELLEKAQLILENASAYYADGTLSEALYKRTLTLLEGVYRARAVNGDKEEWYLKAIACNNSLIELCDIDEEADFIMQRYLNNARMFEELNYYKNAEKTYEECEELYPEEYEDIYIGHIMLLVSTYADEEKLKAVYQRALKVDGIRANKEFKKISERMDYERKNKD